MSSPTGDGRLHKALRNSFSRSPHPYRRKSVSLSKYQDGASSSTDVAGYDAFRSSDSSEDHAVEADDEKGPLLRLPAPPLRARKGLKGVHDPSLEWTPAASPLPTTPTEKSYFPEASPGDAPPFRVQSREQEDLYTKYTKRRRTEIVRRATETLLLLAIGLLNTLGPRIDSATTAVTIDQELDKWVPEIIVFCLTFGLCYALYPIRKSWTLYRLGLGRASALRRGFHVPSRFDPGILIYPVLLPLFIAASLSKYDLAILVNMVLGISALPPTVIPVSGSYGFHWILSVLPVSDLPPLRHQMSLLKTTNATTATFHELVLLFPLHQSLVTAISQLVSSSLDPAEIQLLSAGLINLLLFATTPQSQILKALLWVGGLCLFVFCESALKAQVALARIPAWRFARNRPSKRGITGRINRILQALLPESRSRFAAIASSEDEDDTGSMRRSLRRGRKDRIKLLRESTSDAALRETISADEGPLDGPMPDAKPSSKLARSSTFSTFGRAAKFAVRWRRIANSSNPYLRLSFLHAQTAKLVLAVYTYLAVAAIILLPVRYFIDTRALGGYEAIGWAVGYFIGDIPQVRMFVVSNNLDRWIKLPVNKAQVQLGPAAGWMERYQKLVVGSANMRLLLAGYCALVVGMGIATVLQLKKFVEVDTRRKVFHGVMVALLLPTVPIDPCFFSLALMIVLAVFLMLDLFRASQLPPISRPLTNFLAPYVDGRDHRGPVVVSPIFLLIGCAIPLWLSMASVERQGAGALAGWDVTMRDVSMVSGVVCVGMGDAAASLVGRRYGKTKWFWAGGKSIEGSAAFAVAVTIGLTASWLWLRAGGWVNFASRDLSIAVLKAGIAGTGASLMESTLTAANDNVVVPVGLWLLVRGLAL